MLTPEQYEAKRQARYERLLAAAEKAEREGDALYKESDKMASIIPMVQPILVRHYSEGRDRRYRERIHDKMRKGYVLHQKAVQLRERAAAVQKNRAIFSDDPQASEKLEAKVERLEQRQAFMKLANKLVRAGDTEGLLNMGFAEGTVAGLMKPDSCGRVGYPDYMLTNNNANIRRLKKRLEELARKAQDVTSETQHGDIRVVDNVEDNRLQVFFPEKPSVEIIKALKAYGFRWTPSLGCWQSYRNTRANWAIELILKGELK